MFWMIFLVALLNLGIGCALATHLGHGPPGLMEAWEALCARTGRVEPEPTIVVEEPSVDTLAMLADVPLEGMFEAEAEAEIPLEIEPPDEIHDEDAEYVAELLASVDPEHWEIDEKYVETSVLKLNIAMIKSGLRTNEIDAQLRTIRESDDAETAAFCCERLVEDCEVYLQEQADMADRLCERMAAIEELASLADEIQVANTNLTAQIEMTLNNLRQLDVGDGPDTAVEKMLEEIGRMRAVRHEVRDYHDTAFLAIARQEDRLDKIEPRLFDDQLTELPNRIGLFAALHKWWDQDRQRARQISLALFDLDQFADVNAAHGPSVAERILYHVAGLFREQAGERDLAGRYAGQQFFLALCDVGPRTAVKKVERTRQSVSRMTFEYEGKTIGLTTSVGITEVQPDDTLEQALDRLEAALAKAKEQGPDCTVDFDGTKEERIESPNLGAEYNEITL